MGKPTKIVMKYRETEIEKDVYDFLKSNYVKKNSRILIGFSGGPDSSCLMHILKKFSADFNYKLFCAYVSHGIRSQTESGKEIKFIKSILKKENIKVFIKYVKNGEIQDRAKNEKRSIEELARFYRYTFFERLIEKEKMDFLALGHNQDDNNETIIMRFFQGSGSSGLSGIPSVRGKIIRPLLFTPRNKIMAYLKEKKIGYNLDLSNLESNYLRNKIRLKIIPVIKDVFPGYAGSLLSVSRRMEKISNLLKKETSNRVTWKKGNSDDIFYTEWDKFKRLPEPIKIESIYERYNSMIESGVQIPFRFLNPVLSSTEIRKNRIILRGYGLIFGKKDSHFFCKRDIVLTEKKSYLIYCEKGETYKIVNGGKLKISNFFSIDSGKKHPLLVRSKRPGDAVRLKEGRKTLKKLFSGWKVPFEEQWEIPIVADREEILAVLGKPYGYKNRFSIKLNKRDEKAFNFLLS